MWGVDAYIGTGHDERLLRALTITKQSREEAIAWIEAYIVTAFSNSGCDAEQGYWWGRNDGEDNIYFRPVPR